MRLALYLADPDLASRLHQGSITMNLSGSDWLTLVTATGPALLCHVLRDCSRTLSLAMLHSWLVFLCGEAHSCCSLTIYNWLYLLESTMQKRGETWERISFPLVIKQRRVSGFAELVANILLPVLFPQAPLFKPKISTILLERRQLLGELCLWIHT